MAAARASIDIREGIGSMTSTQIIDTCRSDADTGEKRLIVEVLAGAIAMAEGKAEFVKGAQKIKAMREAGEWIAGRPAAAWKLSFNFCCEVFDIEPAYLRRGIMRLAQPYQRKRQPMARNLKVGGRAH